MRLNSVFSGGSNVFIAHYDSSGKVKWVKGAGGEPMNDISVDGCAIDSNGNTFITGTAGSIITRFGTHIIHNELPGPNTGRFTAYLAKYDVNGAALWAKNVCGNTIDYTHGYDVAADNAGNAYVSGNYSNYCSVKPGDTLPCYGNYDAYVAKFDGNGNGIWATHAGGTGGETAYSIGRDGSGNLYISGTTTSATATFGNSTIATGGRDVYIAKLSASTGIPAVPSARAQASVFPNPTSGMFTIKFSSNTIENIEVTDLLGKVVYRQLISQGANQAKYFLTGVASGMYYVRLGGKGELAVQKVMYQP